MRAKTRAGLTALLLPAAGLAAQPPAPRDWSVALRQDAQALHDDIAANHPGPVNAADPGFALRNEAELKRALERARDARSYADYFFALREYVAAFNDGHLAFGVFGDTPNDYRWPGFATACDNRGAIRVSYREPDSPLPLGARLIGCDGLSAEDYSAATLGRMWGRWQLESQHQTFGSMLFLDEGNRYIPKAQRCTFDVGGEQKTFALTWKAVASKDVGKITGDRRERPRFSTRRLDDGTRWFAIPSFDANPDSPAGKALPQMIREMDRERPSLAGVPAIVLDLRGNGGGSSDWSLQIAEKLWGRAALRRLPASRVYVDWRASKANLDDIRASYDRQRGGDGFSPEARRWFETVIRGLSGALARGEGLWRERDEEDGADSSSPGAKSPPRLRGPVYVVTDARCGSACLDAVDLWRAMGAIHVGRTTSADTLYMDVRRLTLPSGVGEASMPMKVYRGRPRGANEPIVPVHLFDGDIDDTAALEQWLASLRQAGRKGKAVR